MSTIELYEDSAGEYRWRLVSDNGNTIADSGEGYSSKSNARDAIERVKKHGSEATALDIGNAAFEVYEDSAGEYRWRLRHRNGNILSDSGEGYDSRAGAIRGIESVKRNGPDAGETET